MKMYRKKMALLLAILLVLTGAVWNGGETFISFASSGTFWTTDSGGVVQQQNHYLNKKDVYIQGEGFATTTGTFQVRVLSPNGVILSNQNGEITIDGDGKFGPLNLWDLVNGFADTPNSGDVYKVEIDESSQFDGPESKTI